MKFQRFLSVVVAVLVFVGSFSSVVSGEAFSLGDVDGDGVVTVSDALEILKYLAKLPDNVITKGGKGSPAWNSAIIKGGDAPSIGDALEILKKLAKLDNSIDNLAEPNAVGNTSGNNANFGLAAVQGDWVYYSCISGGIWKSRTDGTGKTRITDDSAFFINVVGDWIYYNGSDMGNIYGNLRKIRTDGTEKTDLNDVNSVFINVADGWIYYLDDTNRNIYKVKTDGTGVKKLTNSGKSDSFCMEDGYIYYADYVSQGNGFVYLKNEIHKIDTDGNAVLVIDGMKRPDGDEYGFANFIISDGWIYYEYASVELYKFESSMEHNTHLGKIRTDGTEAALITNSDIYKDKQDEQDEEIFIILYNIDGDWIFFINGYGGIYKIRTDGTELTKIHGDKTVFINIVGDWIYYIDHAEFVLYRMDKDGKNVTVQLTYRDRYEYVS